MEQLPHIPRNERLVLQLLFDNAKKKAYGLELVEDSGGRLKRGSVYVTLSRMEDKGLLTSKLEPTPEGEQGPGRRVYELTGYGERVLMALDHAATAFGLSWRQALSPIAAVFDRWRVVL